MKYESFQSLVSYSIDESFEYCASITSAHYENFPVASFFLPKEKRPYIQAIYAFSRIADDFADEFELSVEERLLKLNEWENKLYNCYLGNTEHPVFIALAETIKRLEIPINFFTDLLKAFKSDVVKNRYENFDDLLGYCKHSANPVGRLVLWIFGYRDEPMFKLSDNICTALQLTNFWQDVAIDKKKDRLYIPLDDMQMYGYSLDEWQSEIFNEKFVNLMKYQIERTRELFYKGAELPSLVDKDLQLELKLIWFGGMAILKKIEKNKCNVFEIRPRVGTLTKILILLRGLLFNDLTNYGKKRKIWDLT